MKVKLDANEFKRLIDNTKRFVNKDALNELMSWIYLEINAEEMFIKATALDGHRVSIEYAGLVEADESFTCYIRPVIPKVTRYDSYAELEVNKNRLYAQVGESIIGYVQPEGQFYNVDKFMEDIKKEELVTTLGINAKYLKDAMESISFYDSNRKIAKIEVHKPHEPVVIKSGRRGERENLKIILPINIRD